MQWNNLIFITKLGKHYTDNLCQGHSAGELSPPLLLLFSNKLKPPIQPYLHLISYLLLQLKLWRAPKVNYTPEPQNYSLNVNPEKTEMMLFTNKTNFHSFTRPRFKGTEPYFSRMVKFLLSYWTPNLIERNASFFVAIVPPILSYGMLVLWSLLIQAYII